jgi:restriction system protein
VTIPQASQIITDVVERLQQLGGQAKTADIHDYLVEKWRLTPQELSLKDPAGGIHYKKQIDGAIARLTKTGRIIHPERGLLELSSSVMKVNPIFSPKGKTSDNIQGNQTSVDGVLISSTKEPESKSDQHRKEDLQMIYGDEKQTQEVLIRTMKKLSPKGFQDFVVNRLLPSLGLTAVNIRPFSKDGGIDGEGNLEISETTDIAGIADKRIRSVKCGIQVKRWENTISRPDIQTFRGAITGQFDLGLYISTSDFSKEALEEARKVGITPIKPIDGRTLASLLMEKGLGIKEVPIKVIDADFFEPYM